MSVQNPADIFLRLDKKWSRFEQAGVVILPVPYEYTTSYGRGTAYAPESIIKASYYLELYDEELDTEIFRLTNGIATLPAVHFNGAYDSAAVELVREQVARLMEQGKLVVSIGGEHTIAIGAAQAHTDFYPGLSILHLDAHSDLREEYEGNRYSHASAMARIYEFNKNIVQVGIRSQCAEEAEFIKKNRINTFYAYTVKQGRYNDKYGSWHNAVIDSLKENVYVTLDCDFFDPSLIPALGTPEPGGFGWDETIAFLRKLAARRTIVGFDVNELLPAHPFIHPQFTVAKLIYKMIGYIFSKT